MTELGEQLQEPFQHLCTQQDARSQLESGRPILQQVHRSHNQCKGYGKQFLEMALSEGEDSIKSHIHVSRFVPYAVFLIFVTQSPYMYFRNKGKHMPSLLVLFIRDTGMHMCACLSICVVHLCNYSCKGSGF